MMLFYFFAPRRATLESLHMGHTRPLLLVSLLLFVLATGCNLQDPGFEDFPDVGGDSDIGDGETGDGEPGDQEPGDGETGDGETGDSEPGDGEPPLVCASGDERPCPCEEAGLVFDGVETCENDTWSGDCACPTVCNEARFGPVIEGSSCGLCNTGSFLCENGDARCDQPVDVNPCGGCEPTSMPTCSNNQAPICDADETVQCVPTLLDSIRVSPRLEPTFHTVYYLYIDDPDASCQGWEPAAAHETLPAAYRRVESYTPAGSRSQFDVELPSSANGILRIVVQQDINLTGSTPMIRGTHFACGSLEDAVFSGLPLYFHPYHFRGETTLTIAPEIDPSNRGEFSTFAQYFSSGLALNAAENFARSGGTLLLGCSTNLICPRGHFPGLFQLFQIRRDDLSWDTDPVAGWNTFYPRWRDTVEALGQNRLTIIYDTLFAEYRNTLFEVSPTWSQWINNNLDSNALFYFSPLTEITFAQQEAHPTFSIPDFDPDYTVTASSLVKTSILRHCPMVGGGNPGYCPPPLPWVESPTAPTPLAIDVNLELNRLTFTPRVRTPPVGPLFTKLLSEYIPGHIYPEILTDEFGDFYTTPYSHVKELFNHVAPCNEVHQRLLDGNDDPTLEDAIDDFLDLCVLVTEAPDGEDFLTQVFGALPLQHPGTVDIETPNPLVCPPRLVNDPYHGLRVDGFERVAGCHIIPSTVFVAYGAAFIDTFVPLVLNLE